jgi:hypothetical protein
MWSNTSLMNGSPEIDSARGSAGLEIAALEGSGFAFERGDHIVELHTLTRTARDERMLFIE